MPVVRGGGGQGGRKIRKSVTASLCLMFKWRGRILAHALINPLREKKSVISGKHDIDYELLCSCEFRDRFIKVFK